MALEATQPLTEMSTSKGGRCVGLTTLSPSCADCLEIWQPHPSGNLRTCPDLYRDCFTFLRNGGAHDSAATSPSPAPMLANRKFIIKLKFGSKEIGIFEVEFANFGAPIMSLLQSAYDAYASFSIKIKINEWLISVL